MLSRSLLLAVACLSLGSSASAQTIHVLRAEPISPPGSGWHNWIDIESDPNNSNNLIVCGSNWVSQKNSLSGFLYASFDAGRSWQPMLTDGSSPWVSEESCAFGPEGHAYLIAGVSKVFDGRLHHELGKMHFYRSQNAGRSWSPPSVQHSWADFTTMAADNSKGRYRGRLYVLYHESIKDADGSYHSEIRLLHTDDGGRTFKGPARVQAPLGFRYKGAFPANSTVLRKGSVATVFLAGREDVTRPAAAEAVSIEIVFSHDGGNSLSLPVQVMPIMRSDACAEYPSIAVDDSDGPFRGRIYVAAAGMTEAKGPCQIMLISSSDDGKTWSKPTHVTIPNLIATGLTLGSSFRHVSIGTNREGVIGLVWAEGDGDCWRFSASTDGGVSFLPSARLSHCTPNSSSNLQFLNSFLWAVPVDDRAMKRRERSSMPAFSVRGGTGVVWKTNMTVTPDGLFHPVWMENREGGGQLWTASVSVGRKPVSQPLPNVSRLKDVSDQITFDFANNHFDARTGTISVDLGIINKSTANAVLRRPLLAELTGLESEFGRVEVMNSDNGEQGVGAIWDLSDALPTHGLAPGAVSARRRLLFHISDPKLPAALLYPDLVIARFKLFGDLASSK